MNKFKLVFYMICNSRIKVSVVINITLSSSYYLRIEDLVLASAYCTRHVTVCMPPLSKLHRKIFFYSVSVGSQRYESPLQTNRRCLIELWIRSRCFSPASRHP